LLSAIVLPGQPGSTGIGGNGTGSLVHGAGVLILFTSQETRSASSAKLTDLHAGEVSRFGRQRPRQEAAELAMIVRWCTRVAVWLSGCLAVSKVMNPGWQPRC
jgi:hypothetical protein